MEPFGLAACRAFGSKDFAVYEVEDLEAVVLEPL
jgi:hypothetical protein